MVKCEITIWECNNVIKKHISLLIVDSDYILHGYIKKLGGPFASAWRTRYAKLYPNRLELHYESSNSKPELVLMDHIEEVNQDLTTFKSERSILLRTREGDKVVLTSQVFQFQQLHRSLGHFCAALLLWTADNWLNTRFYRGFDSTIVFCALDLVWQVNFGFCVIFFWKRFWNHFWKRLT